MEPGSLSAGQAEELFPGGIKGQDTTFGIEQENRFRPWIAYFMEKIGRIHVVVP